MIQINNLNFLYEKEKPIISSLSGDLETGKIYGLLGLNGEGKTTLLKLFAGLLFPSSGEIILNDLASTSRIVEFHKQIYFLPDQPAFSHLKIEKFINIYSSFYTNFSHEFLNEALAELKVDIRTTVKELSFGQQKKFHLAFALATNTKYLLLDEPTNGLDIPSKSVFRRLLAKSMDENKTIIISTHLVKDLENMIDHILILKNGQLALDKSVLDIARIYKFDSSPQKNEKSLYTEKAIANYKTITENIFKEESNIDIELLFNAVQQNKI